MGSIDMRRRDSVARGGFVAIGLMAGVTMLVAEADKANAAVIPEVETFLIENSDDGNLVLQFDLFNGALGTLTGMTFTLDSETRAFLNFSMSGAGESNAVTASNLGTFTVDAEGIGQIFSNTTPVSDGCGGLSTSCSGDETATEVFDGTFIVDSGFFSAFLGLGTFDVTLAYLNDPTVTFCTTENNDICNAAGNVSWFGALLAGVRSEASLTLEYVYDPAQTPPDPDPLPEPGTLGLVALGLLGLGSLAGARRRERG